MIRNGCRVATSRFTLFVLAVMWSSGRCEATCRSLYAFDPASGQATADYLSESNSTSAKSQSAPAKQVASDAAPGDRPSEAERIRGLKRTIESEEARLREFDAELNDPDSEYNKAEREFQEIDGQLEQKKDSLQKLKELGQAATAARLEKEIKSIEREWTLAKDRFDLAIEERKTQRDEIATLTQKILKDRDALDDLTGANDEKKSEAESDRGERNDSSTHDKWMKTDAPASPDSPHDGKSPDGAADDGQSMPAESEGAGDSDASTDAELAAAEAEAKAKAEQADEAQEDAQSIAARIADLRKLIAQEQKSLALARKKVDLAAATQRGLDDELIRRSADGAAADELDELRRRMLDAADRVAQAKADVAESADRVQESQSELATLQSQQIVALQEAEKTRLEAEAAKERVDELRNPFAPRNVLQWLLDHGPRLAIMFAGMIAMLHFAKLFTHRTIKLVARGTGRGAAEERENRAKTLVGVFQNAVSVAIVIGGSLMMLDEVGVKVTVLLGGMAVCGLAVAFGAQSLIKDYFYGFVMLLENQYMINDIVKIGEFTGQVERITLRMTVLRDANGVVHFIPNGTINSVSNETHGWSRAVLEVGVAYQEDVTRVIGVLVDLTRAFRLDPTFGPMTLDDATVPAVESLGDSAVVLKFAIKTRPAQQVAVRRELLRRIKARFDELGIEIPFPQRTVYHRYEDGVTVPNAEMKRVA